MNGDVGQKEESTHQFLDDTAPRVFASCSRACWAPNCLESPFGSPSPCKMESQPVEAAPGAFAPPSFPPSLLLPVSTVAFHRRPIHSFLFSRLAKSVLILSLSLCSLSRPATPSLRPRCLPTSTAGRPPSSVIFHQPRSKTEPAPPPLPLRSTAVPSPPSPPAPGHSFSSLPSIRQKEGSRGTSPRSPPPPLLPALAPSLPSKLEEGGSRRARSVRSHSSFSMRAFSS